MAIETTFMFTVIEKPQSHVLCGHVGVCPDLSTCFTFSTCLLYFLLASVLFSNKPGARQWYQMQVEQINHTTVKKRAINSSLRQSTLPRHTYVNQTDQFPFITLIPLAVGLVSFLPFLSQRPGKNYGIWCAEIEGEDISTAIISGSKLLNLGT